MTDEMVAAAESAYHEAVDEGPDSFDDAMERAIKATGLVAEVERLRSVLQEIIDADWIEAALNPQWPALLARTALTNPAGSDGADE